MAVTKVRPPGTSTIPVRCVSRYPTRQTIRFCGVPIDQKMIAESWDPPLDRGHLSRIFRGLEMPSLTTARRIADALGMTLQAFLDELQQVNGGHLSSNLQTFQTALKR